MPYFASPRYLALMLVLLLCLPASADEVEVDIENAPTPTSLVALLPEGGIDAVQFEVWSVTEVTGRDGRVFTMDMYTYWSCKAVDGKLVMEVRQGRAMPYNSLTLQRFTYSEAGEFEVYHEIRESRGKRTADMIGKVEGDELVIKPNPEAGALNANLSKERRISMEAFETHLPIAWMPLVRAYHIRSGHLGYTYATIDLTRNGEKFDRSVEDVGSESIEVDGKEAKAHLLLETSSQEKKGQQSGTQAQTMVLENGSLVSSRSKNSRYTYNAKRVVLEEISERFGLDTD